MIKKNYNWTVPDLSIESVSNIIKTVDDTLSLALKSERNAAYIDLIRSIENRFVDSKSRYKAPVWIFSTGRCGTLSLHSLFSKNQESVSFHRSGKPLVNRNEVFFGLSLGLGNNKWIEEACFDYLTDQVMGEYLSALTLGKQFISVDNHQTAWIPVIAKLFPDSTFVHLIRNPLDEISSWLSKDLFSNHQLHPAYINIQSFGNYRCLEERECDWPILKQLTWHWKNINLYIYVMLNSSIVKNAVSIKSEDLFLARKDTYQTLSQLIDFESLDYFEFKNHFSTKHNELTKKGDFQSFSRESFNKDWLQTQDKDFIGIAAKYGYF